MLRPGDFAGLLSDDSPSDSDPDSDELLDELSSELAGLASALLFVTCPRPFFWLSLTTSAFLTAAFGGGDSLGDRPFGLFSLIGDCDANGADVLRVSFGGLSARSCLRLLLVSSIQCLSSAKGDRCFRALLSSLDELRRRLLSSGVKSRRIRPLSLLSSFLDTPFSLCCARRLSSPSRESLLLAVILDCSGLELDLWRLLSGLSSSGS